MRQPGIEKAYFYGSLKIFLKEIGQWHGLPKSLGYNGRVYNLILTDSKST